jgi:hypothetical protein
MSKWLSIMQFVSNTLFENPRMNFEGPPIDVRYSVFPGRAVCYLPAPPQTRTSGFPAYGSSVLGFAKRICDRFLVSQVVTIH